jgi:hypothetical protein
VLRLFGRGSPSLRRQSLAQPADDRDALLAQLRHHPPVHHPGPGVQQIMGLAALRRGAGKQVDIGAHQFGRVECRIVAVVAAEDDDVVVGAGVE